MAAKLYDTQAKEYRDIRPSYPPELFQFIASKTPIHDLAWDAGAGNGQATISVSLTLSITLYTLVVVVFNHPSTLIGQDTCFVLLFFKIMDQFEKNLGCSWHDFDGCRP